LPPAPRRLPGGRPAPPALPAPHPLRLPRLDLERHAQQLRRTLLGHLVAVDADDGLLAALELLLVHVRGFRDLLLRIPELDRLDHPAELVDALDVGARFALHPVRQRLDRPPAPQP